MLSRVCATVAKCGLAMIHYKKGGFFRPWTIFRCHGSPFPVSFPLACVSGFLAAGWALLFRYAHLEASLEAFGNSTDFNSFSVLVGFLIIFRTQQAYSRFWDSANHVMIMQAEYYNAASALVAFSRHSGVPQNQVDNFLHIIVRLISLLNGVSLDRLRQGPEEYTMDFCCHEVIDWRGLDAESLEAMSNEESKVELILQWIQSLTVDGIKHSIITIPPPLLTRTFQNLANGLVAFHSAYRVAEIPFPWPYAQATEILLGVHWLLLPIVMAASVKEPTWAAMLAFFVALTLTTLNCIATEMEDPFGTDPNDIDFEEMQRDMNKKLLMLMQTHTARVPSLSDCVVGGRMTKGHLISHLDDWHQAQGMSKSNLDVSAERRGRSLQPPSDRVIAALTKLRQTQLSAASSNKPAVSPPMPVPSVHVIAAPARADGQPAESFSLSSAGQPVLGRSLPGIGNEPAPQVLQDPAPLDEEDDSTTPGSLEQGSVATQLVVEDQALAFSATPSTQVSIKRQLQQDKSEKGVRTRRTGKRNSKPKIKEPSGPPSGDVGLEYALPPRVALEKDPNWTRKGLLYVEP